ncbi:DUF2752 domain-containing protein [Actinacidiphila rubida]|uniref:DUF2752 domain-containing protein n=2 Tax=Actinacidiphila rubida TaxID=310780 RepID=UPI0038994E54
MHPVRAPRTPPGPRPAPGLPAAPTPAAPSSGAPWSAAHALRRAAVPAAVLGGAAAAFAYVAAVDPNVPGHYPACPLLTYTGLYCPGCGGLRCAHALAHGRLGTALGDNALAVAGFAFFAVVWTAWCAAALRGRTFAPSLTRAHRWAFWTLLIAFGVVRNLPFGRALVP